MLVRARFKDIGKDKPPGVAGLELPFPGFFAPRLSSLTPAGVGPAQIVGCESFEFGVNNAGDEERGESTPGLASAPAGQLARRITIRNCSSFA